VDAAQYADLFLTESREHLSAINLALLDLERALNPAEPGETTPLASAPAEGADPVASLFRAVHTIKGMSATLRYGAVAALSHEMEALLDRFRRNELKPDAATMDMLFSAADVLESSIERAVAGRPTDPRVGSLIDRIRAAASAPDSTRANGSKVSPAAGKKPRTKAVPDSRARGARSPVRSVGRPRRGASPRTKGLDAAQAATVIRIRFNADAVLRGARAAIAVKHAREFGEVVEVTPDPETFADGGAGPELLEIHLHTTATAADLRQRFEAVGDVEAVDVLTPGAAPQQGHLPVHGDPQTDRARPRAPRDSGSERGRGAAAPRRRTTGVPAAADGDAGPLVDGISRARHVRIDLRRLDALMNLIGELVIARGRLVELTNAQEESALTEAVADAGRLIGDLQDEIMTCRMVPVWQVFDRFPRLVRDAAHTLGKQVIFDVEGKEIELDRSMLDEIGDPIVHLLRNAVDHGIESPETRLTAGKSAQGHLTLSAARDRSAVLIRVTDDGRGIDRSKVLARALASGLVDPTTTTLTDEEVIRLIARPGFTTADRVTDLSGRGVGIDAVQTRVRALGGSVEIKSAPGEGTTVTARLPLTLAIMRALLARVGGESYAFPMAHVDETVGTAGAAFAAVRGQPVLLLRGEAIPFVRLREVVGLAAADDDTEQHIIVVESGGRRTAVAVDELTGQADIVVKQYDAIRGGASLFSGATILGDGAPALIVDVSSLL
jgi:two-component system, chemotaxis family, sensor kinase CheA